MIYADFNATTPISESARAAMLRAMECWGNPSSAHQMGREALAILDEARDSVAKAAGVTPDEIVFTSGGSEANTLVLLGRRYLEKGEFRLVTSRMEHSSIQGTIGLLERTGGKVEYVRTLPSGNIDLDHLEEILKTFKPQLVSLMTANNETGVIYRPSKSNGFALCLTVSSTQTLSRRSERFRPDTGLQPITYPLPPIRFMDRWAPELLSYGRENNS